MLLHSFKDSISPPLAARSRAILSMLTEVSHAEALDLNYCRSQTGTPSLGREDATR